MNLCARRLVQRDKAAQNVLTAADDSRHVNILVDSLL
jgi:hypothetical protein